MTNEFRGYIAATGILICFSFLGCNGSAAPPVHPVSGTATYKGEPAEGALVVFHPLNHAKVDKEVIAPRPSGLVDSDGVFTLTTATENDGAREGDYRVSIVWFKGSTEDEAVLGGKKPRAGGKDRLNGKYADPATSGLTATITSGPNQLPPFILD